MGCSTASRPNERTSPARAACPRPIGRARPYRPRRPFNGWALAKKSLDKRIAAARKQAANRRHDGCCMTSVARFQSLDELGMCDPHVVEALLNHVSGRKDTVAGGRGVDF
jgi:hypothetical protein